ncbi:uncharacterized protein [Fopius arisanus]|uniref:Uncharacterized protein isoform X2 n=1 Tax=Fopius arisanus TaxID=64838 RepID=A0A9R1TX44_9HYME|nr:PREDICTED: uncharacterized protein LOC105264199 isoform X2 [Fopius arisanus]
MKPQKKATVAQKAPKSPSVANKRRPLNDKLSTDTKKDIKKLRRIDKTDELKRKLEYDKKKLEKKKLIEEGKKMEDSKKRDKSDKLDTKKLLKDADKRIESYEDKRIEKTLENVEDSCPESNLICLEKRKNLKLEEKQRGEKQNVDIKKKFEEKKRLLKGIEISESEPILTSPLPNESKLDDKIQIPLTKKKIKDDKKKDVKTIKLETAKDLKTNTPTKDNKLEKKSSDVAKKIKSVIQKKASKPSQKKNSTKKTVVAKKCPLAKKLIEKKMKLVKTISMKEDSSSPSEENEIIINPKKKCLLEKSNIACVKKAKLAKQLKAKLAPKNVKIIKKEKLRKITDKVVKKGLDMKELEKLSDCKKMSKEVSSSVEGLKQELSDKLDEEENFKSSEINKSQKLTTKLKPKRAPRKSVKSSVKCSEREQEDQVTTKTENISPKSPLSNSMKNIAENQQGIDLKIEVMANTSSSDSPPSSSDSDHDYVDTSQRRKKNKSKSNNNKKREEDEESLDNSSNDERARRMRLFGFWSGPKRHRVASLNALAKVHCLYENEAGGVYLGGFCKPKPEKDTKSKKTTAKEEKEESSGRKEKDKKADGSNNTSKRNLRNVPGLRGKHWDMMECSSSSSSSSEDESGQRNERNVKRGGRKKNTPRKKKSEEVMDLKDMVVCKRMASLNASAILAASYSDEKNRQSSSEETESESSEVEVIKRRKQIDNDGDKKKARLGNDDDVLKPAKKVVVLNQDTDVTITGVYVNQTRSTHHEGFCSIAGMQYRISSTSHTQTAATAVATELHEQKVEQPCKSYTPLGALSSMQPPGSQANHAEMSPRRHSAFSAPHQHGYYQPAGPLIQHPPTLPPIKAPPPEPTPTPPQNSEGSDDLIATSTTSGGTNSTAGGFYRAYCPQYYGTPPQYQELCYPPTYPHPHSHPPPYYKYAPAYRRQYYGYGDSGVVVGGGGGIGVGGGGGGGGGGGIGIGGVGGGGGGGGSGGSAVEYQPPPPPPPGEYPMPPYYSAYPPPPPPLPPPPPNPAYLHGQGRAIVDHATFQGCPCPMQSCPKNVDTGPLIGNGKGAPVASGPGLSLPPSALVGPPSPARGLAGLAPPHGANAWDTDRVQLNTHRNPNQNQSNSISKIQHHDQCNNKNEEKLEHDKDEKKKKKNKKQHQEEQEDKNCQRCLCQKGVCTSACEVVKKEKLSPSEQVQPLQTTNLSENLDGFKVENNNVKCESCSVGVNKNISCTANCNVECENNYRCDIIKCEQCIKEGQIAILEMDKDSGILLIDDKLDENCVKEEIDEIAEIADWEKPDYEATVVNESVGDEERKIITQESKCQKLTKRKLSLDSLSDSWKNKKVDKRTLSVGSTRDNEEDKLLNPMNGRYVDVKATGKKKNSQVKRKAEEINPLEANSKKMRSKQNSTLNCLKKSASESSIMETIDNVIQQSLQMTSKKKDCKVKSRESGSAVKRKTVNILSMIKKVPKAIVKAVVTDEISLKTEIKIPKEVKINKIESKIVKMKNAENKPKIGKVHNNKINQLSRASECKKTDEMCEEVTKTLTALPRKKRNNNNKSTKKAGSCKKLGKTEENIVTSENCILVRRPFLKPKWSNGWSWEGDSYEAKVYLTNEKSAIRTCYAAMRHISGDVLRPRDCVLLKSGPRKADLPYVAKIAALWENPDDGEMMFSLLWYYRPEHTEQGRTDYDTEDEVFASRHRDANSVACIEDKCYILTFNEYCRYRKDLRRTEEGLESPGLIVPPGDHRYPRKSRQPPIPVPSDMVLFCRRVYDYRGKKLVKNPG